MCPRAIVEGGTGKGGEKERGNRGLLVILHGQLLINRRLFRLGGKRVLCLGERSADFIPAHWQLPAFLLLLLTPPHPTPCVCVRVRRQLPASFLGDIIKRWVRHRGESPYQLPEIETLAINIPQEVPHALTHLPPPTHCYLLSQSLPLPPTPCN